MRQILICITLLCLLNNNILANEQDIIRNYIKQNFPSNFLVNDAQVSQLTWILRHQRQTFDMDPILRKPDIHIEISRALTRLYCARLLRDGSRDAYNRFVQAQIDTHINNPLTFASFNQLAQHIQQISAQDYALLETATILSAVSLSKVAAQLAQQAMHDVKDVNDNLEFLAITLRGKNTIYPLADQMSFTNEAAQKIFYVLFPPHTNFRHMLYTEGGIGMFNYLRTMMAHKFIDKSMLDLWYAHWVINIAGFRGYVNQHGSIYLNEDVMQAMEYLRMLIYTMLDDPNFDPLIPYLEYRAKLLGFQQLPNDKKWFFTHLACLLRLYNIPDGKKLYANLAKLSESDTQFLRDNYMNGLRDNTQVIHTHVPAFFANAIALTNDLTQVITQLLPVYNGILKQHAELNLPNRLSFNNLCATQNLQKLLNKNAAKQQRFVITVDGQIELIDA